MRKRSVRPVLVPHRPGRHSLAAKEEDIRRHHHLAADVPVVFVEVHVDDASEFEQLPLLEVNEEDGRFIVRITHCASVAHVLAAAALELSKTSKPPEIHFGWSDETPIAANLGFVLFGQGNVPWLVRELLRNAEPDEKRRPRVVMGWRARVNASRGHRRRIGLPKQAAFPLRSAKRKPGPVGPGSPSKRAAYHLPN